MSDASRRSQSPGGARLSISPPDRTPSQVGAPPATPTPHSRAYATMEPLVQTPANYMQAGGSQGFGNNSHAGQLARYNYGPPPGMATSQQQHRQPSQGSSSTYTINPLTQEIHTLLQSCHGRLMGLGTALNRQSGSQISQIIRGVTADIQEVSSMLVAIGKLSSDLSAETMGLKASLVELQTKLSELLGVQARLKIEEKERQGLVAILDRLHSQLQESEKEAAQERERSKQLIGVVADLREYTRCLEEQLTGKRALWVAAKHDPKAQQAAIDSVLAGNQSFPVPPPPRSPFQGRANTPPVTRPSTSYGSSRTSSHAWSRPQQTSGAMNTDWTDLGSSYNTARSSNMNVNATPFQYQPPTPMRPQGNLPPSTQNRQTSSYGNVPSFPSNQSIKTATYSGPSPSRAMVPFAQQQPEDPAAEAWAVTFLKIFDTIGSWIEAHIAPEHIDITQKCANSSRLWDYMCQVTYPSQQPEGDSHSRHLLASDHTRKAFVKRLMVQHLVRSVWNMGLWFGFSEDMDTRIKETEAAMKDTEQFRNLDRQEILDRQARIVQHILDSKTFKEFRQKKTNTLTEQFKQILGPMVNPEVSRESAATGLNDITFIAFEQAANMATSRLHFGYVWNETCSKFSHESHVAMNPQGKDGMTLQLRHYRLMLVITPGITMRLDRGLNIVPKRVLKSTVMVMP